MEPGASSFRDVVKMEQGQKNVGFRLNQNPRLLDLMNLFGHQH
jgi:hypothetical protein